MTTVTITCNEAQAQCIRDALELYTRIGIGQFEELDFLFHAGVIKPTAGTDPMDAQDAIPALCFSIKRALGHHAHSSFGIAHDLVHESTKRAFEIKKQIEKAMAVHREPNPGGLRGVAYDGRILSLTRDPNITVEVSE